MNVAVMLSGGVDSSVAVHLLCEQGYRPSLFYIRISSDEKGTMDCTMEEDVEICQSISRRYGLPFEVVDLHHQYWEEVVGYMMNKLKQGLTPNSDVMCNRLVKFGCFERQVGRFFDATATGHYAQVIHQHGRVWLGTAVDTVKDQTDFLAQIGGMQLSKTLFPIGGLMKFEVRSIAEKAHLLASRRRDSQGICFLGKTRYSDLVRRFLGVRPGDVIERETGRRVGVHQGYWFYTIGQRKGLGLGGGPWYVVEKDIAQNIVYVSRGYDTPLQYGRSFRLSDFRFITENPWHEPVKSVEVSFKIRHTPDFFTGKLSACDNGTWLVESGLPIQGIAPGQFGVIYDREHRLCLGSGEIACWAKRKSR
ncbi:MAG: tRNA 2-thiouridine(34) synthase MnmA [Bacteroidaceae bacterium]|nr:tRNA 2-thiouridine(34) synthase MnmA [Bacteroides sp.]MBQ8805827.1 tRNA 2-thiouridine(34) synthase MnmA [Bacteroidaceae bacterium]